MNMAAVTYQSGLTNRARSTTRPVPIARAVYWRRRFVVALLGIVLVVVMAQAGVALGGSTLAAPERRPASSHTTITVRPGDSLWSIAVRLAPGEDPRPIVHALEQARRGASLQPGEKIEWAG